MSLYLVTGGAGFIGSHLCDALRARGHRVRVLDDFSTGRHVNVRADAELIAGDVADPAAVSEAVAGIDGCFHLAAIASVTRGVEDWLGTHRANLTGTITIFDALRHRQVPVVYASSAAVYGDCPVQPITEAAPTRPLSAYGADKLGCELHARVAAQVHGIPAVGLRFFNVYGPRQDPASPYSGVISIFADRLHRSMPIDIYGDGGQTRDFVYIADVVTAMLAAMDRRPPGGAVFNVCTGTATSVIELARTLAGLSGNDAKLRFRPPRPGDIRASTGSPTAARAALGLPLPRSLHAGLAEMAEWLERAE
ncbi:MAG TPA: NAD-dependent epimerase/dehydratase family protein [Acetobacteraceae bacterium]|nr:NAD-dependent epimerase/dehydratase family protein [Acetobacteraceae bacterium]